MAGRKQKKYAAMIQPEKNRYSATRRACVQPRGKKEAFKGKNREPQE